MHRLMKAAFFFLIIFGVVSIGLVTVYGGKIIVLNPKGIIGQEQAKLLLLSTWIMMIVVIPVLVLTFFISWKYRAENKQKYTPDWDNNHTLEILWWAIPFVIVAVLGVFTWESCHRLDPFRPIASEVKPLRIQVVALQWKWLFIYPEYNVATVNVAHFPTNVPLAFEITADAPMNSFWIPELGGQVYAMAGMRSKLHLMANHEGMFRGFSANISGNGFAGMTFVAHAESKEDFEGWIQTAQGATALDYAPLVEPSEYVPEALYSLPQGKLFDQIIMKYMQ